jgi:hypothetical protein
METGNASSSDGSATAAAVDPPLIGRSIRTFVQQDLSDALGAAEVFV